jgi:hypothetical protein
MSEKNKSGREYVPMNWQNFGRPLSFEEFDRIKSRIAGLHFSKESLDPLAMQGLYAAEALLREVERLTIDNPFLPENHMAEKNFSPLELLEADRLANPEKYELRELGEEIEILSEGRILGGEKIIHVDNVTETSIEDNVN